VATSIPLFVSFEVGAIDALRWFGSLATVWHWTLVAVLRMESVIDVTTEVLRAMEPRAHPNEDTSIKPFWAVIAGGRTAIRSDIIISIGAYRSYTDVDAYLRPYRGNGDRKAASSNSSQHDKFRSAHKVHLTISFNPRVITLTTSLIAPPMSAASCGSSSFVFAPMIRTRVHSFSHASF
jgi:hypothetical protein